MAAFVGFCNANWIIILVVFLITYMVGWPLKVPRLAFPCRILSIAAGVFLASAICGFWA